MSGSKWTWLHCFPPRVQCGQAPKNHGSKPLILKVNPAPAGGSTYVWSSAEDGGFCACVMSAGWTNCAQDPPRRRRCPEQLGYPQRKQASFALSVSQRKFTLSVSFSFQCEQLQEMSEQLGCPQRKPASFALSVKLRLTLTVHASLNFLFSII